MLFRSLYLEAEAWINAEDDEGTFSFDNVCDLLGMNPDYLRQGLLSWRDRERSRYRARVVHTTQGLPDTLDDDLPLQLEPTQLN